MTDFFLGCDGGGTKTDLVVVTGEGRLAASLQARSTYYLSSRLRGSELVGEVLDEAVPAVCSQAGIGPDDTVILNPPDSIADGTEVRVQPPQPQPARPQRGSGEAVTEHS